MAPSTVSGTTRVSRYQKGKTKLDLLKQEIVSGSGISWAYANLHLAPGRQPRQHPTTQFFTGQMPCLPPNQQCQSTEGTSVIQTANITTRSDWRRHCLYSTVTAATDIAGFSSRNSDSLLIICTGDKSMVFLCPWNFPWFEELFTEWPCSSISSWLT